MRPAEREPARSRRPPRAPSAPRALSAPVRPGRAGTVPARTHRCVTPHRALRGAAARIPRALTAWEGRHDDPGRPGSGPRSFSGRAPRRARSASYSAPGSPRTTTGRRRSCRSSASRDRARIVEQRVGVDARDARPREGVAQQRRGALGRVALAPGVRAQPVAELALAGRPSVSSNWNQPTSAPLARSTAARKPGSRRRGGARTRAGPPGPRAGARRTGRSPRGPRRERRARPGPRRRSAIGRSSRRADRTARAASRASAQRAHNAERAARGAARSRNNRRRPTLPGPCGPSTIGAEGLNCSVRNGKRCFPLAIATGNWSRPRPPAALQNCTAATSGITKKYPSSPRPISTGLLHTSPRFQIRPINLVVYQGSYSLKGMGELISRPASRLDAFSGYPIRT